MKNTPKNARPQKSEGAPVAPGTPSVRPLTPAVQNLDVSSNTLILPDAPIQRQPYFEAKGTNTNDHEVKPILCFFMAPEHSWSGADPIYFDLVTDRASGQTRVRLDWASEPVWRHLDEVDGKSLVSAIAAMMIEEHWNASIMNGQAVVNHAPELLSKELVSEIIKVSLSLDPNEAVITLDEFMSTRYSEDDSEINNEEIYDRIY